MPVAAYVDMLKRDLSAQLAYVQSRPISSIFFGGGTPSLFPSQAIAELLQSIGQLVDLSRCSEVTLETNPGTTEYSDFELLRESGVNRLSFGAQSFNDLQLQQLGRIHSSDNIYTAVERAKQAGFENFNIDLMHGLPGQTTEDALKDIELALALEPKHVSWYQLTIEANTAFYSNPPTLPSDDEQYEIYASGRKLLQAKGFQQYEVSAYSVDGSTSRHNTNYWQFGDYLALGAGAHGKVTLIDEDKIVRFQHTRSPKDYLARTQYAPGSLKAIDTEELALEFMMNALRLTHGVSTNCFSKHTGLALSTIEPQLALLREKGWLTRNDKRLQTTDAGHYFLNELLTHFISTS